MFGKISSINVDRPDEWRSKAFLTLDIDWAVDEVILDAVDLISEFDVEATWFVTHKTKILDKIRDNEKFELGIHPNFNYLLHGDDRNGSSVEEVVDLLMEIVPEATSVRSHSATQSSRILDVFAARGLTHESNTFIPAQAEIELKPWRLSSGVTRVPYFWADDVTCQSASYTENEMYHLLASEGLKVFDFHPIHVYLNTETINRYENTRSLHRFPISLLAQRFGGFGTRSRILECLKLGSDVDLKGMTQ